MSPPTAHPREGVTAVSQPTPAQPTPAQPTPGAGAGPDPDATTRSRVEPSLLGRLVREGRGAAKRHWGSAWTLDHVAAAAGLRRPALVAIERGDRLPSVASLGRLHALLPRPDGTPRTPDDLALWLARWTRAQVERAAGPGGDSARIADADVRAQLRTAAALLDEALTPPAPVRADLPRDLTHFATRFGGMVGFLGDRREHPPRSRGDLFVNPAAATDVRFLTLLAPGAMASVRSDKLVAVAGDEAEDLDDLRGVDLLVIAGPNVNWAARPVNAGALFRYDVLPEWERWEARYRAEPDLGSRALLAALAAVVASVDPATGRPDLDAAAVGLTAEEAAELDEAEVVARRLLARGPDDGRLWTAAEVVASFTGRGHADPVKRAVHGEPGEPRVDRALVSLAPNPFDARRVAILVGGIHGPGTAHAVRFLAERAADFDQRPFGGVLEVRLGEYLDWSSTYQQPATLRWLTPPYTPGELRDRFVEARDPDARQANPALAHRTPAQIEDAITFVDRLVGTEPWPE